MEFPGDRKYTKEHEWVKIEGDAAMIGITEYAQQELGEIVYVELPAAGKRFKKGESICVVESTKAASGVYAPIGGVVSETNPKLTNAPELVNSNPYEGGWLVKLKETTEADLADLMDATAYSGYVSSKIHG